MSHFNLARKNSTWISLLAWLLLAPHLLQAQENKQNRLTQCLGREESAMHKKHAHSARYYLNQEIMSHFLQINNATFKDSFYRKACLGNRYPTFSICEILMTQFEDSFTIINDSDILETNMAQALISSFIERLPALFTRFYMHVQKDAPTPDCLQKYIPEMADVFHELKYIQEEKGFRKIFTQDNRITKIFSKIKNLDAIFQKCEADFTRSQKKN